ncbi:exopolysaccharide biosynthesis protein [Hydrogenophaga defluvii]|uniref:Exopolysaccharide biosynthesis protein n=1 Tax=Hydrogenophaga defluvii TaxID=249410 RepID=A0ABW2SES6_9BURK
MSRHMAGHLRARAADASDAWRLTLAELLALPDSQSLPSVLLLSAALTMLPVAGAGTVLSFLLWWVAWAWWHGHDRLPVPRRALALSLSPRWSRRCLHGLAWVFEQADRCLKPRWAMWTHQRTQSWWALWVSLMAALIFLPLPLGNVLPALSLMLVALGWMFRDGLALALAGATGVAALAYVVVWWELLLRLLAAALPHLPWLQAA